MLTILPTIVHPADPVLHFFYRHGMVAHAVYHISHVEHTGRIAHRSRRGTPDMLGAPERASEYSGEPRPTLQCIIDPP